MNKRAFTRLITVLLIVSLLLSSVVLTGATKVEDVYRDGAIFVVTHSNPKYPTTGVTEQEKNQNHVMATGELCQAIEAITYAEILMFEIDTMYVGLPYDSVELVESLDTVQKVEKLEDGVSDKKAEEKLTPEVAQYIEKAYPYKTVELRVYLHYNTLVYYGFEQEDFSDVQDYIEAKRDKEFDYYMMKNQEVFDEISTKADVKLIENPRLRRSAIVLETTVSEIEKIAQVERVNRIEFVNGDGPTEVPSAHPMDSPTETGFKYEEKFQDYIRLQKYDPSIHEGTFGTYSDYDELYEHRDEATGGVDWVLITAKGDMIDPWEVLKTKRMGDRVLSWWTYGAACLPYKLAVYDAKEDKFRDMEIVKPDEYEGLVQVIEELKLGYEIGDTDLDSEVTVLDATRIQMYVADILDSDNVEFQLIRGVSDMDNDGEVSVLDATAVQLKIAKIEK